MRHYKVEEPSVAKMPSSLRGVQPSSYNPINCEIISDKGPFGKDYTKNRELFSSIATVCSLNNNAKIEITKNGEF